MRQVQSLSFTAFTLNVGRCGRTLEDIAPLARVRLDVLREFSEGKRWISIACQRNLKFALYMLEMLDEVGVKVDSAQLDKYMAAFNTQRSPAEVAVTLDGMREEGELDGLDETPIAEPIAAGESA